MWAESCNIPDNTFTHLDIQLPSELKEWVLDETKSELLNCFIESLDISSWSEIFTEIFKEILHDYTKQEFKELDVVDSEYIRYIIWQTLSRLKDDFPIEYNNLRRDVSQSYVVIRGVSINFHSDFTYYAPQSSLRPKSKPIINNWNNEPEWWFQKWLDMNLSQFIKERWLSPYIIESISKIIWRKIDTKETENISLLIRYILEAETWWGYNRPHDTWFPWSGWYFEYQKNDGVDAKEVYNFNTGRFESAWRWSSSDREIKIIKWWNKRWIRRVWNDSSYDMALKRIPEDVLKSDPDLMQEYNNIGHPEKQDMSQLSAEQQIIVLLSDLYGDPRWTRYFNKILEGDVQAISNLYKYIHHGDVSNEETQKLITRLNSILLNRG